MTQVDRSMRLLKEFEMSRKEWAENGDAFKMSLRDGKHRTALDVLSMPDIELDSIVAIMRQKGIEREESQFANFSVSPIAYETVEATSKYCNYLSRQEDEMERMRRGSLAPLPIDLVYSRETFPSFSSEELEQLNKHRPGTLHAASLVQGVTTQSIIHLQNHLLKRRHIIKTPSRRTEAVEGALENINTGF